MQAANASRSPFAPLQVFFGFWTLGSTARLVMHECAVVRNSAVAQGRSSAHPANTDEKRQKAEAEAEKRGGEGPRSPPRSPGRRPSGPAASPSPRGITTTVIVVIPLFIVIVVVMIAFVKDACVNNKLTNT